MVTLTEFAEYAGLELMNKLKENNLLIDNTSNTVIIDLQKEISPLCKVVFHVNMYDEDEMTVYMCYENLNGHDSVKSVVVYYDSDTGERHIVDESRLRREGEKLFVDGVLEDVFACEKGEYGKYELESDYKRDTEDDFSCFLDKYPFSKEFEENDGSYDLPSIEVNDENMRKLVDWLKEYVNEHYA
jgi:hypothetical protein